MPRDITIDSLGGACPLQGRGTVDGLLWYYRSRHNAWSLEVYPEGAEWRAEMALPDVGPAWLWTGTDCTEGGQLPSYEAAEMQAVRLIYHLLSLPQASWPVVRPECELWVEVPLVLEADDAP